MMGTLLPTVPFLLESTDMTAPFLRCVTTTAPFLCHNGSFCHPRSSLHRSKDAAVLSVKLCSQWRLGFVEAVLDRAPVRRLGTQNRPLFSSAV